ncbi:MAG: nucleotidyltransferase family protein [Sphingomonadaceae bacterium]
MAEYNRHRDDPPLRVLLALTDPWRSDQDVQIADASGPLSGIDWQAVIRLAQRHRVLPLVARRIVELAAIQKNGEQAGSIIPPPLIRAMTAETQAALLREMALLASLREWKSRFDKAGIPLLVLKGLVLSQRAYGILGQRVNRDIDILIHPEHLPDVDAMARNAGYQRVEPAADLDQAGLAQDIIRRKDWVYWHPDSGMIVEIHHRLFDNVTLCEEGVMERAQTLSLFGQVDVLALALADEIPFLAIHGALHAWSRLKWVVDLGNLLRTIPKKERIALISRPANPAARRALHQGLSLMTELYHSNPEITLPMTGARAYLLRKIAANAAIAHGETELEDTRFGTTTKNASHYFRGSGLQY